MREKLDESVVENAKRDNLIHDLKEEVKVNFLANQELKKQLETVSEREKTAKSEMNKKEKELKTELDKSKVREMLITFVTYAVWCKSPKTTAVYRNVLYFLEYLHACN